MFHLVYFLHSSIFQEIKIGFKEKVRGFHRKEANMYEWVINKHMMKCNIIFETTHSRLLVGFGVVHFQPGIFIWIGNKILTITPFVSSLVIKLRLKLCCCRLL